MTHPLLKWWLALALVMVAGPKARAESPAESPLSTQLAAVEELKLEAFKALKSGEFGRTNALLSKAAELSGDTVLAKMAGWLGSFEQQRLNFASERRKEYDKAVAQAEKLIAAGHPSFAMDYAARANLLTDDKVTFLKLPWVEGLIGRGSDLAVHHETSQQWLTAIRLYADLIALQPNKIAWRDKMKLATRRVRLLAQYTPDLLKKLQEAETEEHRAVDELVNPSTQPATKPVVDADNDAFRINWSEMLRDIRMDMLSDALADARSNYWKDISYRDMMVGGLDGLAALATTTGLEQTFPNLGDGGKRARFMEAIEEAKKQLQAVPPDREEAIGAKLLSELRTINDLTVALPEPVLVSEFADGAFSELDPFTSVIWPFDMAEFAKATQGEFTGVGIQIQTDVGGSLKVVSPIEDSPAYKAGIKAGDVITHIDGRSAKGITVNQAVKTITGPSGTTVKLTVASPSGVVKEFVIRREVIKVASIKGFSHKVGGGWDYFVDAGDKIAYVRLTNFTKSTSEELGKAVKELGEAGARAVILDLRSNPGGLLTAATEVSDRFLPGGVIVSTRADRETPNQPTVATARGQSGDVDLPMVVLVNQFSASASEIVSGALKDQKRAMVVGERTFGKGSVQMLFPLNNRQAYLKLTTSHYYLPSGRCIHREENSTEWGVDPDVRIEMTPDQMRAAIDARQELDVLRDEAFAVDEKINLEAPATQPVDPRETLLSADPQLSAALLLLRLQLAGAQL